MPFTGATLTTLNNFMLIYPETDRIIHWEKLDFPLLESLKPRIEVGDFPGNEVEVLMKLTRPYRGQAHAEDQDIPLPGASSYIRQKIAMQELITDIGVTKQALDKAVGGEASWGSVVKEVIDDGHIDFKNLLETCLYQNGTGALARVVSCTEVATVYTVVVDNVYADSGIEGTDLLKVGMMVDIYNGATLVTAVGGVELTTVTASVRNNGAAPTGADRGSFVFTDTTGLTISDNFIVYLANSYSAGLPMGLTGLVHGNGDAYAGVFDITTFQNLTRATYPSLQGRVYQATDFGLDSESPADGTPTLWDLDVLTDMIEDVERGTGKGKINLILAPQKLTRAMHRLMRAEGSVSVQVSSSGALDQTPVGSRYSRAFEGPDGRPIPVMTVATIPDNVLFGLDTRDIVWCQKGSFDFLSLTGRMWDKSYADRKTNFEAPFGGYYQIKAYRCDNMFMAQDLRYDVG